MAKIVQIGKRVSAAELAAVHQHYRDRGIRLVTGGPAVCDYCGFALVVAGPRECCDRGKLQDRGPGNG